MTRETLDNIRKKQLQDLRRSELQGRVHIEEQTKENRENIVQFSVDMNEMQRNVLYGLINARKECMDENVLTAHGCVAIIDALFYLVKEKPIWMGVDMGDPNGDKAGDARGWANAICGITGNYCGCNSGACEHRGK